MLLSSWLFLIGKKLAQYNAQMAIGVAMQCSDLTLHYRKADNTHA